MESPEVVSGGKPLPLPSPPTFSSGSGGQTLTCIEVFWGVGFSVLKGSSMLVAQSCPTLCDIMGYSLPGSSVHGDSSGKNTGVGCHFLLQGIFPTQGLN